MIKTMIWDWNGTLLNDAECSFNVLNDCLRKRGLPEIKEVEDYKNIFDFPVIKVYEAVGFDFDKDSFEDLSVEYTEGYQNSYLNYDLHEHVIDILKNNINQGIINVLLSASQIDILKKQANEYKCDMYFEKILGLNNIYAHSKVELAKEFMRESNLDTSEVVWIGDSIHDYECAKECGTHCILVANGHQTKERLIPTGATVVDTIDDVIKKCQEFNS